MLYLSICSCSEIKLLPNRIIVGKVIIRQIKLIITMDPFKEDRPPSERVIPALAQVYQLHQDLLSTITEMDVKIEQVIRSHQAQFLLAYRNHIKKMKEQLWQIKQRGQQQQKKIMSNDRAIFLQKQIILFREQALQLFDKLQEKTQENEINKTNNRELQKAKMILEKQNKDLARQIKILEAEKNILEAQIETLTGENKALKEQAQMANNKGKVKPSVGQTTNTKVDTETIGIGNNLKTPKRESLNLPIPLSSKKISMRSEQKAKSSTIQKLNMFKERRSLSNEILDHEIKSWFIDCLQTIRRQVGQRKVYGFKSEDINNIGSWQEFRMIDKLRLLQMFMQNQKLLVWMYQKIFPSRLSELEGYFSSKKKQTAVESRFKSKSMSIQLQDVMLIQNQPVVEDKGKGEVGRPEQCELPRVIPSAQLLKKNKKYDVRGRIQIKNGKLNLSQMKKEG